MTASRIRVPQQPPFQSGLSKWMDSQVGSAPGVMLDSVGPTTMFVRNILQSEQHTSTLVANTFWQSYVESPAFSRDLTKVGVLPSSVRKHEILVVAHGMYRCSLLLTDDSLAAGEVRSFVVSPNKNELASGWMVTVRSRAAVEEKLVSATEFPTLPLLAPAQVLPEVVDAQPFAVVITAPMEEELTSVPSPHVPKRIGVEA
jgi:hypothetical protein